MLISHQRLLRLPGKLSLPRIKRLPISFRKSVLDLFHYVKSLGYTNVLDDYELVKLGIFNQLNFFQLLNGMLLFFTCLFSPQFPLWTSVIAALPAMISFLVLYFNKRCLYEVALIAYFILHPLVASFIFMNGIHLGLDLYFILYGILAVFFLKDKGFMVFTIGFSMVNFFILSVVLKQFVYQLENINNFLYLFNEGITIVFIFYGLYLIKNENSIYQLSILRKNNDLQKKNLQIQIQADKIKDDATLLEKQTKELTELNAVKNKLFGIISHDLKGPMYAVRSVFSDLHKKKMTSAQLRSVIPEVVNDLNYTVDLMDNLLQWAKTQMQSQSIYPQKVDIGALLNETIQLVRLQAERKKISIDIHAHDQVLVLWIKK
jgi:two-component system sensor histidine kinase/response regulator